MLTKWTQHLSSIQEKEEFQKSIRSAKPVLERVIQILEEKERFLESKEFDLGAFNSPSWPYLQAAMVGKRSELRETKRLLTLDQEAIK